MQPSKEQAERWAQLQLEYEAKRKAWREANNIPDSAGRGGKLKKYGE